MLPIGGYGRAGVVVRSAYFVRTFGGEARTLGSGTRTFAQK